MRKKPLYEQIKDELREQILSGRFRSGDRLPSETELMEHYDVSAITAKRVLNDLCDEGLVNRIKGRGSFVAGADGKNILNSERNNLKGVVGIIFPSTCMPVESALFYHIQSGLYERKYQTLVCLTDDRMDKEIETIRMFRAFGIRGFIIFPAINERYNEEILRLSLERFPHVLVDRYLSNISSSFVVSDNCQATRDAVFYLLKQRKNIAFITQKDNTTNTKERFDGFERAFSDQGLPIDTRNWFINPGFLPLPETGEALKEFLSSRKNIDGIICVNTPLASLTYAILQESGRRVPEDVTLVSFDDPKLPFVPYVEQDVRTIGLSAVDILVRQMENEYFFTWKKVPTRLVTDVAYPQPFSQPFTTDIWKDSSGPEQER